MPQRHLLANLSLDEKKYPNVTFDITTCCCCSGAEGGLHKCAAGAVPAGGSAGAQAGGEGGEQQYFAIVCNILQCFVILKEGQL